MGATIIESTLTVYMQSIEVDAQFFEDSNTV